MEKPHVLWVEIGFGIAVAVFAALVVIGRHMDTAAFAVMMLIFLAAFITLTVAAELAAMRAEAQLPELWRDFLATERRQPGRSAATDT